MTSYAAERFAMERFRARLREADAARLALAPSGDRRPGSVLGLVTHQRAKLAMRGPGATPPSSRAR